MPTTATYSVNNPTSGTEYVAPSAYWVIPNGSTQVKCTVQSFDGNGNLLQVANLYAIVRDVDTNTDKGSFSGNYNTASSIYSGPNGTDKYAPAGKVTAGGVARLAMYLTYTGTAYDNPPNAPSNLVPLAGATVTTLTPTFQGSFTDPDVGDTLYRYEIIVNNAAGGGGSQVWDSGTINASGTETTNAQFSKLYNGPALAYGTTYSWKARVADQKGAWGAYSAWQNFSTLQGPNAPSVVTPAGLQGTVTPGFGFTYSSPAALGMQSYHYTITSQNGGSLIYDSGVVALALASGASTSGTIPGGAGLQNGQAYFFNISTTDTNGVTGSTTTTAFSIAPGPSVSPISPIQNASVNSQQPTFLWSYTDPNYTQATYRFILQNAATSAQLWDSGVVGSAGTSFTLANLANPAAAPVPTAAAGSTGLLAGTYTIAYTWVTALGETMRSPTATVTITAGQKINLAPLTPLPANVLSVNFYMSIAANNVTLGFVSNGGGGGPTLTVVGNGTPVPASNTSGMIPFNTQIRWQVTVTDTVGFSSGASAWAYATIVNTPTATITSPTNGATITTATPTIQWTYTASVTGNPQASAQLLLMDANSNLLATYTVNGAGTTFTLPVGILVNNVSYKLQVKVTDTGALTGQSAVFTFTLQYTPPADMQGQALANAKNWVLGSHFLLDTNLDGIADNWVADSNGPVASYTYSYSTDANVTQPWQQPNGDGPYQGAQKMTLTNMNGAGPGQIRVAQTIDITVPGWIAGTTRISLAAWTIVQVLAGSFGAYTQIDYYNAGFAYLSSDFGGNLGDTAGQVVQLLGPQNVQIPATTRYIHINLCLATNTVADVGSIWYLGAQLEAAAASDPNFIAGDRGTGYSFDFNGYSIRSNLSGNLPTIIANPGADTDPINATGGSITINWDTSLADATRFQYYLLERRRQDQANDDTQWIILAQITQKTVGGYTDFTCGGDIAYQYSVRQVIVYPADGSIGYSGHRALVFGSVHYAPAWYLTNTQGLIYNLRMNTVDPKRKYKWKERAQYNDFIGRLGTVRDAGPDAGYDVEITAYFDELFGDDAVALRRQLVTMQKLNVTWYLRGQYIAIPVHLDGWELDQEDTESDTLTTLVLDLLQAQDSTDY